MPGRTDIESILIVGAGPIVIGQACEFDYSGTQACKALRQEGYRVVLANSNPATVMTDPDTADATYIEPITPALVERVIAREKPDALLATMGGQTALNTAFALAESGALAAHGVELIGADREAIARAEDREQFRAAMANIGLETPRGATAGSLKEAHGALERVGLPAIVRPSFTLGGAGGGVARSRAAFDAVVANGLDASPVSEVLIEESVAGWKEYEMEVIRDRADNGIVVCSIENIDPMGVHTGDSVTVAPALTLTDKEYQTMRDASLAVLREIGVETGGSNVQFAVDPATGRMVVIEMNPRVSRSSALASKATGFPIAKVAAKLAVGFTLDEIGNDITGTTPASFEPTIDYVVTKIPRFTFEKFPGAEPTLTTSMKSVGEAMAIGRTFEESLQKALCSTETGLCGLDETAIPGYRKGGDRDAVRAALGRATPDRLLVVAQAFREGLGVAEAHEACRYDPWFLRRIAGLVAVEETVRARGLPDDAPALRELKKQGFSDARLAALAGLSEAEVARRRRRLGVHPVFKRVDTCAAEFDARTPYLYSTYDGDADLSEDEAQPGDRRKAIVLGGGPNRIGQGIEFDYCCVHAAYALRDAGFETVMVNCNPETVSTDYDTSDRLYFEPLTAESVLEIARVEGSRGVLAGAVAQFGGQTPLKIARALEAAGLAILGTAPDAIDLAEDRKRFQRLAGALGLRQPPSDTCRDVERATAIADRLGYPVLVRPSYVLGGRAMEIVRDRAGLERYVGEAVRLFGDAPILIDRFLADAVEVDVDALCDGEAVYVAGVMEHIEEAGIHSGDSACSLPPYSLGAAALAGIEAQTAALARALGVRGSMNVQFAVKGGGGADPEIYVIEVNPRASRTVPFVAKATGVPVAGVAARLAVGARLADFDIAPRARGPFAVKEAVFPFARFPGVDVLLGPEMKSTGEAMGLDADFGRAFAKSQIAVGAHLPERGAVFVSVRDADKGAMVPLGARLAAMGFSLLATGGTADRLEAHGLAVARVRKVREGGPHLVDAIADGKVDLIFNTTEGERAIADSYSLRRAALANKVPYYTTVAGCRAAVEAIAALRRGALDVAPLQSYS